MSNILTSKTYRLTPTATEMEKFFNNMDRNLFCNLLGEPIHFFFSTNNFSLKFLIFNLIERGGGACIYNLLETDEGTVFISDGEYYVDNTSNFCYMFVLDSVEQNFQLSLEPYRLNYEFHFTFNSKHESSRTLNETSESSTLNEISQSSTLNDKSDAENGTNASESSDDSFVTAHSQEGMPCLEDDRQSELIIRRSQSKGSNFHDGPKVISNYLKTKSSSSVDVSSERKKSSKCKTGRDFTPPLKNYEVNNQERISKTSLSLYSNNSRNSHSPFSTYINKHTRLPYSREEKEAILKYIIAKKAFNQLKSIKLYRNMVKYNICPKRTEESMRNHFLRKLIFELNSFDFITDELKNLILNKQKYPYC